MEIILYLVAKHAASSDGVGINVADCQTRRRRIDSGTIVGDRFQWYETALIALLSFVIEAKMGVAWQSPLEPQNMSQEQGTAWNARFSGSRPSTCKEDEA
jgi:hypothetical protein